MTAARYGLALMTLLGGVLSLVSGQGGGKKKPDYVFTVKARYGKNLPQSLTIYYSQNLPAKAGADEWAPLESRRFRWAWDPESGQLRLPRASFPDSFRWRLWVEAEGFRWFTVELDPYDPSPSE